MIAKVLIMTVKIMTIRSQNDDKKLKLWHKKSNYLKSNNSDFSFHYYKSKIVTQKWNYDQKVIIMARKVKIMIWKVKLLKKS